MTTQIHEKLLITLVTTKGTVWNVRSQEQGVKQEHSLENWKGLPLTGL